VVPFTDDECEALRAAAPDWFAAALTLGLGAGLRLSEATGLTLDRIDALGLRIVTSLDLLKLLVNRPPLTTSEAPAAGRSVIVR